MELKSAAAKQKNATIGQLEAIKNIAKRNNISAIELVEDALCEMGHRWSEIPDSLEELDFEEAMGVLSYYNKTWYLV